MIDKTSPDWPGFKAFLQLRIETHRKALESGDCLIKEADHLRGKIMEDRAIIEAVEPGALPQIEQAAQPPGVSY